MKFIVFFISLSIQVVLSQGLFVFETKAADDSIKVQLKWTHQFQFAGFYAALEKGYYADAGLDVEFVEPQGRGATYLKLLEDEITFAVMDSKIALLTERGLPLVVLSVFFQESPLGLAVRSDKIKSLQDLAGKNFEIEEYSSSVFAMLAKNNINIRKSNVSNHSLSSQDFIDGRIDAMTIYTTTEPFALKEKNIPFKVYHPKDYGINFYGDTLVTSLDYLKNNPEEVKAFNKATLKGWEYAAKNENEIIDLILVKYNQKLSKDFLEFEAQVLLPLLKPSNVPIGNFTKDKWQNIIDVFVSTGFLDKSFDMSPYLYDETKYSGTKKGYWLVIIVIFIGYVLYTRRRNTKKSL